MSNEPSPREVMGIDDAVAGDVKGLCKFVYFMNARFRELSLTEFQPDIAVRVKQLKTDTERLSCFLDGFISGSGK